MGEHGLKRVLLLTLGASARRRRASTEHTLLAEDSLPAETSIAAGDENEIEDSDEHMTDNNGEQSEPEGSDEHMTGCSP